MGEHLRRPLKDITTILLDRKHTGSSQHCYKHHDIVDITELVPLCAQEKRQTPPLTNPEKSESSKRACKSVYNVKAVGLNDIL
jgi:hypothetical protein